MKKFLFLFMVLFLILSLGFTQEKSYAKTTKQYATRGFYWGDSISTVKKKEKLKLYASDSTVLIYPTTLYGYKANLNYYFTKGKLSAVMYTFKLPKFYYGYLDKIKLHNYFYSKLKPGLNTKSKGYTTTAYTKVSTLWQFNSREVFLEVYDNNGITKAAIAYVPRK